MKKFKSAALILCACFLFLSFFYETKSKSEIYLEFDGKHKNLITAYSEDASLFKENSGALVMQIPNSFILKNHNIQIYTAEKGIVKIYLRAAEHGLKSSKPVTYKNTAVNGEEKYSKLSGITYDNPEIISFEASGREEITLSFGSRTKVMPENIIPYAAAGLLLLFFAVYAGKGGKKE